MPDVLTTKLGIPLPIGSDYNNRANVIARVMATEAGAPSQVQTDEPFHMDSVIYTGGKISMNMGVGTAAFDGVIVKMTAQTYLFPTAIAGTYYLFLVNTGGTGSYLM